MTILDADGKQALARLREVFARRPPPYDVSYCSHCFEESEMRAFLRKAPDTLAPDNLERIVWKAYTTWGDWPSLAYYVPRLLDLYAQKRLPDNDMLFHKLLWPARPEVIKDISQDSLSYVRERMQPDEQRAIAEFVQAVARVEMRRPDSNLWIYGVQEAFDFLATFDPSIAPLIEAWKQEREPWVCGRFCLLVAEYALEYDPARPRIETVYSGFIPVLPENAAALAALVDPAFVSSYLAEHAASAALFGPDGEEKVGIAFDWAVARLQKSTEQGKG